jgi:hypothetical protein
MAYNENYRGLATLPDQLFSQTDCIPQSACNHQSQEQLKVDEQGHR